MDKLYKIRLKKGDTVMVRSGKFKGQRGKIMQVHPKLNKVTVEGINIVKKHQKPTAEKPQGGIVEITKPLWVSKVGILDSTIEKPTKVSYKISDDGKKTRVYKTSGKEIK